MLKEEKTRISSGKHRFFSGKKLSILLFLSITPFIGALAQDGMGIGTNDPKEMLHVVGAIQIGTDINNNATTQPVEGVGGTIRFRSGQFEGWEGSQWVGLDSQGGADADWTVSGINQYSAVSGNVGIGTATPVNKLDILTNSNSAQGIHLMNTNTGSSAFSILRIGNNFPINNYGAVFMNSPTNGQYGGANSFNIIHVPNAPLTFGTANQVKMTIIGNGNIGIGTAAPSAKLEVAGQVKITGGTPGANKVLTSDAAGLATWVDPNILITNDADWTVSGNNQYSAVSGNVGIGTTTPQQKLTLSHDSDPVFRIDRSGSGAWDWEMYATSGGRLTFRGGSDNVGSSLTDRLTILGDGNVGIGIIGPDAKLNVNGTSHFQGVSYFQANVGVGTASPQQHLTVSNATSPVLRMDRSGGGAFDWEMYATSGRFTLRGGADNTGSGLTDFVSFKDDGNLGIGTTTPSAKLEVTGQVKITGGTPGANKVLTSDATGLAT